MKKNKNIRYVCFLLCVLFFLQSGCTENAVSDNSDSYSTSFENKNDELTLYCGAEMKELLMPSVQTFRNKFPEVKVNLIEFGDVNDPQTEITFKQTLQNDLAAGKGPDVIVWTDSTFQDINKTVRSGIFEDLNSYLQNDSDFREEDFVKNVFDGGLYGDERLFIPLGYDIRFLISTEAAMEIGGLQLSKTPSLSQWHNAFLHFQENKKDSNVKFTDISAAENEVLFLSYSGVPILDYDTGEILVRSEAFRLLMEMNKVQYNQTNETDIKPHPGIQITSIRNQKQFFSSISSINEFFGYYAGIIDRDTPAYYPFPNLDGEKGVACATYSAAIRKNSQNKDAAYEFMKILLSDSIQSRKTMYSLGCPVRKESLVYMVNNEIIPVGYFQGDDNGVIWQTVPEEEVEQIIADLLSVEYSKNNIPALHKFILDAMLPYFKGDKSYETCLDELENKLGLYIYE